MSIYVRDVEGATTLYNFINECYPSFRFVETYCDEACTELQCREAYRSFEDLLEISRTYFPGTTEEQLAKVLFELNLVGLEASYCHEIQKVVFSMFRDFRHVCFYEDFLDDDEELGDLYDEEGLGEYSIKDIYDLAGEEPEL